MNCSPPRAPPRRAAQRQPHHHPRVGPQPHAQYPVRERFRELHAVLEEPEKPQTRSRRSRAIEAAEGESNRVVVVVVVVVVVARPSRASAAVHRLGRERDEDGVVRFDGRDPGVVLRARGGRESARRVVSDAGASVMDVGTRARASERSRSSRRSHLQRRASEDEPRARRRDVRGLRGGLPELPDEALIGDVDHRGPPHARRPHGQTHRGRGRGGSRAGESEEEQNDASLEVK